MNSKSSRALSSALCLWVATSRRARGFPFSIQAGAPPFHPMHRQRRLWMSSSSLSQSASERLFPEELNVLYDSKCNVCKLEIEWLAKRDKRINGADTPKLRITDIEDPNYDPTNLRNGKVSYKRGMEAIHAIKSNGEVVKGVPVFELAYEQVRLGWIFKISRWPIFKDLIRIGYDIFAKYRTYITRGSSIDDLVRAYEQRNGIKGKDSVECESDVCRTPIQSKK